MAKKERTVFACNNCGYQSLRWLGKCPECGEWDSFNEETLVKNRPAAKATTSKIQSLMSDADDGAEERLSTEISELDRVLGGGIVPGGVTMVGGDPGIGKSTLMLQMLQKMQAPGRLLYVSGEESFRQVRQRAKRLGIDNKHIFFLNETGLENVVSACENDPPVILIIDSIQTMASEDVDGIPGNSSQLRYCTARLTRLAKDKGIAVFLIGHVTKDGAIAGPRMLEHLVDTVVYFEGDDYLQYRVLRSTKNRFGAVNEIGLFRMESDGLSAVSNPSEFFLDMSGEAQPGTGIVSVREGNRIFLVEVQALVSKTQFGMPQRVSSGLDQRRVNLILAVLDKKAGRNFGFHDVFLKVAGGLKLDDPAADLGICMALISAMDDNRRPARTLFVGEVGLNGEIKSVGQMAERVNEASKLGIKHIVLPPSDIRVPSSVKLHHLRHISGLLDKSA